ALGGHVVGQPHLDGDVTRPGRKALSQCACKSTQVAVFRGFQTREAQGALVEPIPVALWVGLPGPLKSEFGTDETVGVRRAPLVCISGLGSRMLENASARGAAVVAADDGPPVILPVQGLKVHDPAAGTLVLEVEEPLLPVGSVHPRALVRSV